MVAKFFIQKLMPIQVSSLLISSSPSAKGTSMARLVHSNCFHRNIFKRKMHSNLHPLLNKEGREKGAESSIAYAVVPRGMPEIVSNFLLANYHLQEPITVALGMPLEEVEGWFQRFIRQCMYASVCDVSVQAIDETVKKRVGVLSSIIVDPATFSKPVTYNFIDEHKHPINTQMEQFYDALETDINLTQAAGIKLVKQSPPKILEHLYISVDPNYANQGISNKMVELSESLALNIINCRIGYTISTSEYSYAVFQKNGYKVVKEIKYADYTNANGDKIFADKLDKLKPHHTCRAMIKVIEPLF